MSASLRLAGDRTGHVLVLLLLTAGSLSAAPGAYKARRFDVTAAATATGDLDVAESITFEFQSGTFTRVWRDIPASRTDGIRIFSAAMDGKPITEGDGPGHFTVSGRNRVRVEWHFPDMGPSVHRFDLRYLASGVVYRASDRDVLRWTVLPTEHRYAIDESRIRFEPAGAIVAAPETHRIAAARVQASSDAIVIDASGVESDGWIVADLRYPAGTLTRMQPAWLTRQAHAGQLARWWAMGGAAIFAVALLLILTLRQAYSAPETFPDQTVTAPPQPLAAALASILAAKGRAIGYQPVGTLLDLADRGVLTVREVRGVFGVRSYEISQVAGAHDLDAHELAAVQIAFAGRPDDVTFSRARGRLARASRRFTAAVNEDLLRRGLLDPDRKAARDRMATVSLTCLFVSALGGIAVAPFIPAYGAWPFLLPLGLLVAAIVGLVISASMTPLSDDGLREAARWRGFKRCLRRLATGGDEPAAGVPSRWIVYALAAGLGPYWARYLKRHPDVVPAWFASAAGDPGAAFAAFVGSHAGGGAAGSAGGGAAGGGGSGAG